MLGRRNPQQSFFEAQNLPHRVDPESFYGRMGAVSDVLFRDDDLAEMYDSATGRPSLPPSLLSGVMLLQFYDDASDREAVENLQYDLRWKVALNLPLDYAGFDPSSLTYFRQRLLAHGRERYAFDRLIQVGRAAGFLPEKITALFDTTDVKGAGAVQDTYTLLRKGIRKLLRAAGFHLPGQRQGLAAEAQALLATYLDQDRKADIDWADPAQRAAQLKILVQDTEAALELATAYSDEAEVRAIGWLLTKILGDDIVTDPDGHPQIGQGTAPDRIVSITDPEMRHGRKSKAHRFNGFKALLVTEQSSELLVEIADVPAPGSDGEHLLPAIRRIEAHTGLEVERALGDGAFGSGDNRAACAEDLDHPVELVAPVARPADPEVGKSAFQIDLEAQTATCPQGQTVAGQAAKDQQGRPILTFTFPRATCATCPLFARCVHSKTAGRTVRTHAREAYLQAAREFQQTAEFQAVYPLRSAIEHKIAEGVRHGLRQTRYLGEPKRQLQRLWLGAAINLKRLFKLAETRRVDLAAAFGQGPTLQPALLPA
jgi:transposase